MPFIYAVLWLQFQQVLSLANLNDNDFDTRPHFLACLSVCTLSQFQSWMTEMVRLVAEKKTGVMGEPCLKGDEFVCV